MTTPFDPQPCGTGGTGEGGADVEQTLICDIGPDGEILGTALAVYEYDSDGNPVGAPTFVDPATGVAYVAQGVLQPCPGDVGCGAPTQFCFQSTVPVDQPGRIYDTTLTLAQGFAVQGLVKDLVDTPLNIVWEVTDPDGSQFAADLQLALQSQFPGQTVTVTPGVVDPCLGGTADFAVHIECLRLDQNPPTLLQFRYNSGRDLILNPAFLATPPTNQFAFLKRQDEASGVTTGDVNCTNVANRGWETNDNSNSFETWGPPGSGQNTFEGTTPTPRGTVVQEINSFGSGPTPVAGGNAGNPAYGQNPNTIWQTFVVPAAGNFTIRVVVGGRGGNEAIPIKLSTGDVNDTGIGDIINTVVNAGKVTNENATPPGPWTTFNQTVPLAAGTYTLAFTGPVSNNGIPGGDNGQGGLFTDMRVFQDAPNTVQNFVNDDDTCTVPTTSTSTVCEYWAPRCAAGQIVGWYNVATGEELTNAAFWTQVPAPICCPTGSGDGGETSTGNLVYTYLVCGTLNGETRTMSRVVVSDQSGGIIADTFVDTDGAPVTPDTWQPGDCSGRCADTEQLVLCDTSVLPGGTPAVFTLTENQTALPSTGFFDTYRAGNGYVQNTTTAGQEQAYWDGVGLITFPAAAGPAPAPNPNPLWQYLIAADLDFTTDCDFATADVSFSADMRNTSVDNPAIPVPGYAVAHMSVYNRVTGVRLAFTNWLASDLPPGGGPVLKTVTANNVPASAFPNLMLVIVTTNWQNFALQGLHANSFESEFQGATVNLDGTCSRVQFLRTVSRDCNGAATVVTDTTLDGLTPYTVTGDVGLCVEPTGSATPTPVDPGTDAESIQLCDDNGPFLRTFLTDVNGALTAVRDTDLDGALYSPVGAVGRCPECPTVLGEVCYSPPVPGATLTDNWAGATSTTPPGQRVWTNSNFAGAGITVTETVTPDTGAAIQLNGVRNTATGPAVETTSINLGAPRTNVRIQMDFFGSTSGERLRNISPAIDGVTGNGTAVLANTGVDGGPAGDGTIVLLFTGPVQTISWDYSPVAGGLSIQSNITFTEINPGDNAARAVRVLGCDGEVALTDLRTGTVLDEATVSVFDCPCCPSVTSELVCADGAPTIRRVTVDADGAVLSEVFTTAGGNDVTPATWTPGTCGLTDLGAQHKDLTAGTSWTPADAAGTVTSLTYTVLSGSATVADAIGGTVVATLPTGLTVTWTNNSEGTLSPPVSITADAASRVYVHWTEVI